ncbi:hypothetical protein A5780_27095 [Nocardia sp. 852002-20019_SCH5090214]|uniref:hypothetical protein n=1 Tax=Nocardia sp. 852002-20019_SCH5090214 TaxID=1834087 RepID=UPI0007A44CB9|nr:hypothetical protein [Nocardia sp. 852002-20019_SCH5090214]OBA53078.1 hypothetical protein A5780_27095 [Nocardia sp. 852002-20019_SCH5090214]PPJ02089.1 hypothetical protein C5E51_31470 [Nocardia nova]
MGVELITDSGRRYSARTTDAFTEYGMEIFREPMSEVLRLDLGGIEPLRNRLQLLARRRRRDGRIRPGTQRRDRHPGTELTTRAGYERASAGLP